MPTALHTRRGESIDNRTTTTQQQNREREKAGGTEKNIRSLESKPRSNARVDDDIGTLSCSEVDYDDDASNASLPASPIRLLARLASKGGRPPCNYEEEGGEDIITRVLRV